MAITVDNRAEVLRSICSEVEADVNAFEGKPFDGNTVAAWLGNISAAIVALAKVMETLLPGGERPPNP